MVSQPLMNYFLPFWTFMKVWEKSDFYGFLWIFIIIFITTLCVFRHCCTGNFILAGQPTEMMLQGLFGLLFFFFPCDSCGSPVITVAFKCFNRAAVLF